MRQRLSRRTKNDGYFAVLVDKVRQHKSSLFSIFVPSGLESVGKAKRRIRLQVCSSIIVERVAASRTPKEAKPYISRRGRDCLEVFTYIPQVRHRDIGPATT
ncbi:hypothetical protein K443DRAFT_334961 [Laccaria amethystina LaAM-08-1]|uniref:Uncharacterized protein n=1 Tax=Laccaria amethystina LaAM-08-1 TaxID=1095629 RepID=A0A0C9YC00_9AGAR|nr:hypothetical protein K443DRAFT_334961 [Laccaria amethystina LaAM-08-1]